MNWDAYKNYLIDALPAFNKKISEICMLNDPLEQHQKLDQLIKNFQNILFNAGSLCVGLQKVKPHLKSLPPFIQTLHDNVLALSQQLCATSSPSPLLLQEFHEASQRFIAAINKQQAKEIGKLEQSSPNLSTTQRNLYAYFFPSSQLHLPRLSTGRTSPSPCGRCSRQPLGRGPSIAHKSGTTVGGGAGRHSWTPIGVSPRILGSPWSFLSSHPW